ncbi:MAG: hypothetical protein JXN60_06870, partial [Lentisphaerae bacterium]|nr:hypothetical protein [Lentisphaerota bacterium]
KTEDFLTLLKPFNVLNISRSGAIAIAGGE